MSNSATKQRPSMKPVLSRCIAVTADRMGRKPNEHGRKTASNTGSSTSFTACCTTLSRTVGMPSAFNWCREAVERVNPRSSAP